MEERRRYDLLFVHMSFTYNACNGANTHRNLSFLPWTRNWRFRYTRDGRFVWTTDERSGCARLTHQMDTQDGLETDVIHWHQKIHAREMDAWTDTCFVSHVSYDHNRSIIYLLPIVLSFFIFIGDGWKSEDVINDTPLSIYIFSVINWVDRC